MTRAHHEPGDLIIKQGDPPSNFYDIEQGEVEIIHPSAKRPDGEVIATLGTSNFFGEHALINLQLRTASVRARSVVEVVVMDREVFSPISKSLAPLRTALAAAIMRRTKTF